MAVLWEDLRVSFRQLARTPLFTAAAVLTLAVGMGINTVAFGVVNGVLFKSAASRMGEGLGRILVTPGGDEGGYGSRPDFDRFAEATAPSLDLAAEGRASLAWRHDGGSDTAYVLFVSPTYFSLVNAPTIAGRLDVHAAGAGPIAVMIGERFWRERLGAPSLTGLTLRLNDADVQVAGVIAGSFTGPGGLYSPDIWIPLDAAGAVGAPAQLAERDTRWLFVFGRLREGWSVPAVQGQLDGAVAAMAREWPATHRDRGARFRLFRDGDSELGGLALAAAIAMGIIGLVLLLACFNVANLLLARAVERERDLGVRAALGAAPARLMRLVITEGAVIAAAAGLATLLIAQWTKALAGSFAIPIEEPQHLELSPDGTVIAFVLLLVVIAGVLPGVWPALAAARVDVARAIGAQGGHAASGRPSRLRQWLVGAQVAGSTAFLALAALFVQAYAGLHTVDLGLDTDHVVVALVDPASSGRDAAAAERYARALQDRVAALPGVRTAAIADRAPFFIGFERLATVTTPDRPCDGDTCRPVPMRLVGPGYFDALGVAMAAGNGFGDTAPADGVIISSPLATSLWADGRAIGRAVRVGDQGRIYTVVGVTAPTHARGLDRDSPTIYLPLSSEAFAGPVSVIARVEGDPGALVRPIADAAATIDPAIAAPVVKTMRERMAVQLWPFRTISVLFAVCGGLALVLATAGLAAVVMHSVSQRRREFSVRLSLGASPRDLALDVVRGSAGLLAPGLAVGLLIAAGAAQLLRAAIIGVNVINPATYLAVALIETLVVLAACLGPAINTAQTDPLQVLR